MCEQDSDEGTDRNRSTSVPLSWINKINMKLANPTRHSPTCSEKYTTSSTIRAQSPIITIDIKIIVTNTQLGVQEAPQLNHPIDIYHDTYSHPRSITLFAMRTSASFVKLCTVLFRSVLSASEPVEIRDKKPTTTMTTQLVVNKIGNVTASIASTSAKREIRKDQFTVRACL